MQVPHSMQVPDHWACAGKPRAVTEQCMPGSSHQAVLAPGRSSWWDHENRGVLVSQLCIVLLAHVAGWGCESELNHSLPWLSWHSDVVCRTGYWRCTTKLSFISEIFLAYKKCGRPLQDQADLGNRLRQLDMIAFFWSALPNNKHWVLLYLSVTDKALVGCSKPLLCSSLLFWLLLPIISWLTRTSLRLVSCKKTWGVLVGVFTELSGEWPQLGNLSFSWTCNCLTADLILKKIMIFGTLLGSCFQVRDAQLVKFMENLKTPLEGPGHLW